MKQLKKQQRRLKARQSFFARNKDKDGHKKPGSMNRHKSMSTKGFK